MSLSILMPGGGATSLKISLKRALTSSISSVPGAGRGRPWITRERGTAISSGPPSFASILSKRWLLVDNCCFICSLSPLLEQRNISMANMSFMAGLGLGPAEDPAPRLLNVSWSLLTSMPGMGWALARSEAGGGAAAGCWVGTW